MCDCHNKDDEGVDKTSPDTVTLFEKCTKRYHPGQDMVAPSISSTGSDKCDSKPTDNLQYKASHVPSLMHSGNSSESSRTYKFVSPTDGEELCEDEEDFSPLHFEPCEARSIAKELIEEEQDMECTLAIIKPEAILYRKQIERRIFEEGFEIYQTRWLQLTPEQVSEFYADSYGQLDFAHLVAYMSSASVIVHVLGKSRAVDDWRLLIGPTKVAEARLYYPDSIRARYGRRGDDFKNAVHGSENREKAEKEIHFFFPEAIIEPLMKNEVAVDYLWDVINPILVEALTLCCKLKPADPVLWLANWLILNNPNKPKLPEDLAMIPT